MKNLRHPFALVVAALCALYFAGCVASSTTPGTTAPSVGSQIASQLTPQVLAKGTQDVLAAVGSGVLVKNPAYNGEVAAAADAFTAIASGNPAALTPADVVAALSKTKISPAVQQEVATYVGAALGLYESDFKVNFPALQPNYRLFATAIANGLNLASGNPGKVVPLPSS